MPKQATDVEPQLLDRYIMYGELAAGGMATVHFGRLRAAHGFSRTVAIKCLHPQYAKDPAFRNMFLDEARIASRIQHPNVVTMLDVVQADDGLFLVMDYIAGESLARLHSAARSADEHVPPPIAAAILAGTLVGLHAAHEATMETGEDLELVHRDVSPQNILVGRDGVARVLDFGIARAAVRSQVSQEGQLKGKLRYMAPEQLRGETVTRRTDIYAAAVVLWEVLTGQSLFGGNSVAEIFGRILEGVIRPPSTLADVPPAVDEVVLRNLSPHPKDRYATALEMAEALEEAITPAGPRQVGAWVERTAGERLSILCRRIAAIEAAPVTPEKGSALLSSRRSVKTSSGKRADSRFNVEGAGAAATLSAAVLDEPSDALSTPVSTPPTSARPASVRWLNAMTLTDAARPFVLRPEEPVPASKTLASASDMNTPPPSLPPLNAQLASIRFMDAPTVTDAVRPNVRQMDARSIARPSSTEPSAILTPIDAALESGSAPHAAAHEPPSPRARRSAWVGGGLGLVAGVTIAAFAWRDPASDTTARPESSVPAVLTTAHQASSAPAVLTTAHQAPSAPEIVLAPNPIRPDAPEPAPTAAREAQPASAPTASAAPPQPATSARPAGRKAPAQPSCNPPYYVDKDGFRRVKRGCY